MSKFLASGVGSPTPILPSFPPVGKTWLLHASCHFGNNNLRDNISSFVSATDVWTLEQHLLTGEVFIIFYGIQINSVMILQYLLCDMWLSHSWLYEQIGFFCQFFSLWSLCLSEFRESLFHWTKRNQVRTVWMLLLFNRNLDSI